MNNLNNLQKLLNPLEIQKENSRRSYYSFIKYAWKVLEPQTLFIDNWHIKYLCDLLQNEVERIARGEHKDKDIIINIPPRSMKTGIVTIYLNAWVWLYYPYFKFITTSYSQDLSTEHSIKTRRLIESEWYQSLLDTEVVDGITKRSFKMTSDQNVKSKFENDKSGVRYATSVGGALTGSGADIFITDDPHKANEAKSETARKGVIDWWKNTAFSRLNNQEVGLRIIVMQRLHEGDLTGEMLKNNDYRHINIPAELTKDTTEELRGFYQDGLFFPKRFNREVLDKLKSGTNMGTREYTGQYLQQPSPDNGDIIKRHWFRHFAPDNIPAEVVKHYYTDSAYGKEESDNSATIVYSVYDNNLYIWACWFWNLQFPDFIKRYIEMINSTGYRGASKCLFEPKASGVSIVQQLRRIGGINVVEDKAPVDSKISRVQGASASIEAGRIFLLDEGAGIEELIEESIKFPNAKNDDGIDALSSVIKIEIMKNSTAQIFSSSALGL